MDRRRKAEPDDDSFPVGECIISIAVMVVLILGLARCSIHALSIPETFNGTAICKSDMDCELMERKFHSEAKKVDPPSGSLRDQPPKQTGEKFAPRKPQAKGRVHYA